MATSAEGMSERPPPRRVLAYAEVVAGARKHYLRNATIRMDELADELAVGRATLYRLVAGRDQLIGDVLWTFAEPILDRLVRTTPGDGLDKVIGISLAYHRRLSEPGAFRTFLTDEPETAIRVLCTPAGNVHERTVRVQRAIFRRFLAQDGRALPADLDGLAYLYVRIMESLLYADLMNQRRPQLAVVERAARAVLAGLPPPP